MELPLQTTSSESRIIHAEALRLHRAGRFDEAMPLYTDALKRDPGFVEAHYNLGCALHAQGRLREAVLCYERAIALYPRFGAVHVNLGNALKNLGQIDEAMRHYGRALTIDPSNADAHYNLATAFKDMDRFTEASEHYRQTLAANPNHISAHNNLGILLRDEGRIDEALHHFRIASALDPEHAESQVNEAMTLLLAGEFIGGWKKYEWRWRVKGAKPFVSGKPLWDGGDLKGKTILLCGEQGLGDCIQFVRYAAMVKERAASVVLSCPQPLARLFTTFRGADIVISEGDVLPDHDCHAPLMSLPMLFGTTLDNIPNTVPYLFPFADEAAAWAQRMKKEPGLKVGLVWAGHSRHNHPAAQAVDRRRSMRLEQFALLAEIPGVTFYSLQKGEPAREAEAKSLPGLIGPAQELHDFASTAALVANLDLVIGVDTSVIHLAGAVGKPVWVLSRFDGCWRWLLGREDSPWYPGLRLFRQPAPGDWSSVILNVYRALNEFAQG